jgi:oxygen-independent coproporphyrinogen-3 oxidase
VTASLYIHVPFCAGVCDYCDFYSIPVGAGDRRMDAYIDRLLAGAECLLRDSGLRRIPTAYIGGGTPSVLGAARFKRLLKGLGGLMAALDEGPREFTVEANPESADRAFLEACREGGVNRLSLGVQSFHEASRRAVHRVGGAALLPERLKGAREIFGSAFSADIISGLPLQGESFLLRDLERLLEYEPGHVSLYSLTVEPGTPLAESSRAAARAAGALPEGAAPLPGADEADRLWLCGRGFLEKAGYEQYEVSNFARPGKRSAHTIRYWRMENWLALGPAASATIISDSAPAGGGRRYTVLPDLEAWLKGPPDAPPLIEESPDAETLMKETFLMGFRYIEGPDPALFERRFGVTIENAIPETLARWRERGLAGAGRAALNREGLLLLNPFLLDVFEELETSAPLRQTPIQADPKACGNTG